MKIEEIHIKGFRNFVDETIRFQEKTLIIGANDVGKTNLIYALRLLFDKSISDSDLELADSDYNAYSNSDSIEITVKITNITEECLLSVFGGAVKNGVTYISYLNSKDGEYLIKIGFSLETMEEKTTRYYIKRFNMQRVDTNRELLGFLKREKSMLLQTAKEKRDNETQEKDETCIKNIQEKLDSINSEINTLSYVGNALKNVNDELSLLSANNEDQNVSFIAGQSDANKLLENLTLSYSSYEKPLSLGGDGRNNQIYLATWIAKQKIEKSVDHVTFYAIEEPEAHLHPHQQRKLSQYIQNVFEGQIFITTHSPHIVTRFKPSSIVRLFEVNKKTKAACGGCSALIDKVFKGFNYRLNTISAETFFSSGVFLVEGISEVLFYTALSDKLGIDLDRENISIISVDGIGFKPYVAICEALKIPWVLRTDNDILQTIKSNQKIAHYSGVSRIMNILYNLYGSNDELLQFWEKHKSENEWDINDTEQKNMADSLNSQLRAKFPKYNAFLSENDLENDLANSNLYDSLKTYYKDSSVDEIVNHMKIKKGENMFNYLTDQYEDLSVLMEDSISTPIILISKLVKERMHPQHDKPSD